MLIAIIGPDGCGKTTLAKQLEEYFKKESKKIALFEFRYGILPTISKIFSIFKKGTNLINENEDNSYLIGMISPKRKIVGIGIIVWYSIEHLIYNLIHFLKKENSYIHIFARYSYDYLYMRAYRNLPIFIRYIPTYFAKEPDLIFTINRTSEDIFKYKPELTLDEISKEKKIIEKYLSFKKNFYFLNPNKKQFKTLDQAIKIINDYKSTK